MDSWAVTNVDERVKPVRHSFARSSVRGRKFFRLIIQSLRVPARASVLNSASLVRVESASDHRVETLFGRFLFFH